MKVLIRTVAGAALACALALTAWAQEIVPERLKELNKNISDLTTKIDERSVAYPKVIKGIRDKTVKIEKAQDEVAKLIADLNQITDQMDIKSDYRKELKALEDKVNELIVKVEQTDDDTLKEMLVLLKQRYAKIQKIDRDRAEAVIKARAAVRDLEDNQERLVLIIQIGHIDGAIAILEASLKDFKDVVEDATAIARAVDEEVIASP